MDRGCCRRQVDAVWKNEGAPVGMPQSPFTMDEQADRALMYGLAAGGEPLERQLGRAVWINIQRTEFARQCTDDPARPAVQRVRQSVAGLQRASIDRPLHASRETQQDDRPCARRWRQHRSEFSRPGMECAANRHAQRASTLAQPSVVCGSNSVRSGVQECPRLILTRSRCAYA